MKGLFKIGDRKNYQRRVRQEDTAFFESGQVHPVYATFALARDAEWACRLFVLEMKEADEEGIGTMITVHHHSPAAIGETVDFMAEIIALKGNSIVCRYEAKVGERLIASGEQGQKILKKTRIASLFKNLGS